MVLYDDDDGSFCMRLFLPMEDYESVGREEKQQSEAVGDVLRVSFARRHPNDDPRHPH